MRLFDAHCHLQDERLLPILEAVLERAGQAGVTNMMCCGSEEGDWPRVHELAQRFPQVQASFGLHPWYVGTRRLTWLDTLRRFLADSPAAVGEIGLDHAMDRALFETQETVLIAQLNLARELHRPVSLHCRQAWGRLLELLDRHGWPEYGLMFHSFSGSKELVPSLVKHGAFCSFSGSITHPKNVRGRKALAAVPLERLLIETDSPDILPALPPGMPAPVTASDRPVNEPANLPLVLKAAAEIRAISPTTLAEATRANALSLWHLS
jgi:TatD DNase family protein